MLAAFAKGVGTYSLGGDNAIFGDFWFVMFRRHSQGVGGGKSNRSRTSKTSKRRRIDTRQNHAPQGKTLHSADNWKMALAGLKFCFIAGQKEKMPQMKFFTNIVRCSTNGMHMKEITDYKNIDIENWLSK